MKAARSYVTFTRKERYGLVALSMVLAGLIAVRIALPYFVHPPVADKEQEGKLLESWERYKRSQPKLKEKEEIVNAGAASGEEIQAIIDLNTADSESLVQLKGIGPALAGKILRYRMKYGRFEKVEQILDLQYIPPATFSSLRQHLRVDSTVKQQ